MKKKFKVNKNDTARACELASKLVSKGVRCWFSITETDISACKWWIAPAGTDTHDAPIQHGGIGVLLRELREACFACGALVRPKHISNRNPIRLSVNGTPVWTTSNGG